MADFATFELPSLVEARNEPRLPILRFIAWLEDFYKEVVRAVNEEEYFAGYFIPGSGELFASGFIDYQESQIHRQAYGFISEDRDYSEQIRTHGLYGWQLIWKLRNVKHWLDRFIQEEVYPLFGYLLNSINALLKSILDSVPGGGGIIEFKEAIENSLDQTSNPITV